MSERELEETDPVERLRPLLGREPSPDRLERIARGVEERLDAPRAARSRLLLAIAGASALAAAVLLIVLWRGSPAPTPTPSLARLTRAPAPTAPAVLESTVAEAVALGPHQLRLAPRTRVRVLRPDPRATEVSLDRGKVEFAVKPLGGSFKVQARGVLVEVVGTRFTVEEQGGCSVVEVSEGRVRVSAGERRVLLERGDSERFCAKGSVAKLPGEEIMREALAHLQRGESREALALLTRYLQAQPRGAFEEEARFHLCLVQARLGRTAEARRSAEEFVARFPTGRRAERLRRAFLQDGQDGP